MKSLFSLFVAAAFMTSALPLLHAQGEDDTPAKTEKKVSKAAMKKGGSFKFEKKLKSTLSKAKKAGLPVMLIYSNPPTCRYCRMLEDEVLSTKEWKTGVAGKLLGVYIDNDSKDRDADKFAKANGVRGIPTYFLLKPDGTVISRGGYTGAPVARYISMVDKAYQIVHEEAEAAKAEKEAARAEKAAADKD